MTENMNLALAEALDAAGCHEYAWIVSPLVPGLPVEPVNFADATMLLVAVQAVCEQRNMTWLWRGWHHPGRFEAQIFSSPGKQWVRSSDTPEEALAQALLAALCDEKEGEFDDYPHRLAHTWLPFHPERRSDS